MSASFDRSQEPAPGLIRDYEFPAVRTRRLDNGIRTLICRAGDIPLITAHVIIDAGAGRGSAEKSGIANLTASALEGGTRTHAGTDLAWALEELGLDLTAWASWDAAHVRITATTDRIEPALALLADIVRNPVFSANEVERIRDEQLGEIMQRITDPRALADDVAPRFIYGNGSTYQRTVFGSSETVAKLTREDVVAFHAARYQPDAVSVLLVGDVDAANAHTLVANAFGDWSGKAAEPAPFRFVSGPAGTVVHIIDRPGAVQSELRMGHVGVARNHADHYTLNVLNALLGGAFTSRLNLSLREKHGFTYGVRSSFALRREAGPFLISSAVGTEVTARALEEAFREVRAVVDNGVTEQEVANARDYLAGVLPLQLQSTEDLANKLSEIVVYDLPDDYFQGFRRRTLGVTRDAVEAAAREFLKPDEMAVVIVGDASAMRADIEKLDIGTVKLEMTPVGQEVTSHG